MRGATEVEWKELSHFLSIKAAWPDNNFGDDGYIFFAPSKRVDKLWHNIILTSTCWYDVWCNRVYGRKLEHARRMGSPLETKRTVQNTEIVLANLWPATYDPVNAIVLRQPPDEDPASRKRKRYDKLGYWIGDQFFPHTCG